MMAMSNMALAGVVLHKHRSRKRQQQASQMQAALSAQQSRAQQKPPKPEIVGLNWRLRKPLVYLCWQDCLGWQARVQTLHLQLEHWEILQDQAGMPGVIRKLKGWGYL